METRLLTKSDPSYPSRLNDRLGTSAPDQLTILGNSDLLALPKTALCSSVHCPGHAVNAAYDQAAKWRDAGRCVISGFHSPMEQECLRILLCGPQPLILCPARSLENLRVPADWKAALDRGRLLILSGFGPADRRVTAELAARRNELVAALADEVWFAHITPGGQMEQLARRVAAWKVAVFVPLRPAAQPGDDRGLASRRRRFGTPAEAELDFGQPRPPG